MTELKVSEAQKKSSRKYLQKGKFINVFFNPAETDLFDRIDRASKQLGLPRTTYIKQVLKGELYGSQKSD